MARDVEILVHISAPSTSKDDTVYRELATAYMDFLPGKSTNLASFELPSVPGRVPESGQDSASAPAHPATASSSTSSQKRDPRDDLVLPTALDSPLASFRSVWDNITSPRALAVWHSSQRNKAKSNSQHSDAQASADSWVQPPSEVPDSMPYNDLSLAGFTTPTRVLNYFLQTHGPLAASSQPSQLPATVAGAGALAEATATATYDDGVGDSTMLLLQGACAPGAHLPSSDTRSGPRAANLSSVLDISSDRTHVTQTPSSLLRRNNPTITHAQQHQEEEAAEADGRSGVVAAESRLVRSSDGSRSDGYNVVIPATQPVERADSEPPLAKRRRHNPTTPYTGEVYREGDGLSRSVSDVLPQGITKHPLLLPSSSQNDLLEGAINDDNNDETATTLPNILKGPDWSYHLELMSSDPPPTNAILGHKPTIFLEDMYRSAKGPKRYNPRFQARPLRPYERGFWTLSLADWPVEAKRRTWQFLGNYIRKDEKAGWGTRACRDQGWDWLRLYGWEHIVGELYILLYVASERRTKYVEMVWRDGAGEVLIIVGARAKSS